MEKHNLWRLARTPVEGWPTAADFSFLTEDIPEPGENQFLSRTIYLSMDPYQWVRRRTGIEKPGDICHGRTISRVTRSRHPDYMEGDYVFNTNGWTEYALTGEGIDYFNYMIPRKLDADLAPISTAIGVLGMLGLTAYAGSYLQCEPQPGETFVVSAASGGVGQVAGQIAKLKGCRVVGVAGVSKKCDYVVNELGFDACVSHLSETLNDDLTDACPDGIDIYFENVGGKVFEAIAPMLNPGSRISVCGLISQYGNPDPASLRDHWNATGEPYLNKNSVKVHDLFVGNFVTDHQDQFLTDMAGWYKDGLMKYKEYRCPGLETAPDAQTSMLRGANFGKTIVEVSDELA